ncbi:MULTISPECIES: DUF4651 domain-containing protein [unclassified Streptococcus]|nr:MULTISPECIES: DUF4651 domain-containing protein [unclassified Streptococcus]TFV06475.1 DUF4651 domain-containing protein [Streptococcus sp. LYSM12]MBF0786725.1 DUF4651 domain-containing protein [Streptococcus sp. 19428wC2_LYSM12]MCQ9211619.1 DUF4651 domain-containing protein [Streptococcus sp. B01]MCQ9213189.1 DUF4651 domain-containing protein [Streptococcus sp. O1]MCQ9214928.1 DUF4651 domain-containing protein [Streptococcus sp. O1]
MKKKKGALLAGVVGASILAASAWSLMTVYEERKKAKALQQVRAFFEEYGEIATVFINEMVSSKDCLVGGVVMENGQSYLFENEAGVIWYEEELI